jgi:hypothetical protein
MYIHVQNERRESRVKLPVPFQAERRLITCVEPTLYLAAATNDGVFHAVHLLTQKFSSIISHNVTSVTHYMYLSLRNEPADKEGPCSHHDSKQVCEPAAAAAAAHLTCTPKVSSSSSHFTSTDIL